MSEWEEFSAYRKMIREAKAEAWDEGARWAAVECRALETEGEPWLTPSDNPYREETE